MFVADPPVSGGDPYADDDDEDETVLLADQGGPAFRFEPPADGTLRYAVRPWGELLLGDDARRELPRGVNDDSWTPRVSAVLRSLRRFRERVAGDGGAVFAFEFGRG